MRPRTGISRRASLIEPANWIVRYPLRTATQVLRVLLVGSCGLVQAGCSVSHRISPACLLIGVALFRSGTLRARGVRRVCFPFVSGRIDVGSHVDPCIPMFPTIQLFKHSAEHYKSIFIRYIADLVRMGCMYFRTVSLVQRSS